MSVEVSSLLETLKAHEDLAFTVDPKTLEILDRRRRTAVVKRRGWLMRRMLLVADVVGLTAAMTLAEFAGWTRSHGGTDVRTTSQPAALTSSIRSRRVNQRRWVRSRWPQSE